LQECSTLFLAKLQEGSTLSLDKIQECSTLFLDKLKERSTLSLDKLQEDSSLSLNKVQICNSRTVPGSIPGGVTGFFSDIFPYDRTMSLGSTQPVVKMSTRNFPGGKGDRCVRLTTSPPSCAKCHEIWEPKPPGILRATPGLLRDPFTFYRYAVHYH
jgi:hypothetical protein